MSQLVGHSQDLGTLGVSQASMLFFEALVYRTQASFATLLRHRQQCRRFREQGKGGIK